MILCYQFWVDPLSWAIPVSITIEPANRAIVIQVLCCTFAAWKEAK